MGRLRKIGDGGREKTLKKSTWKGEEKNTEKVVKIWKKGEINYEIGDEMGCKGKWGKKGK